MTIKRSFTMTMFTVGGSEIPLSLTSVIWSFTRTSVKSLCRGTVSTTVSTFTVLGEEKVVRSEVVTVL